MRQDIPETLTDEITVIRPALRRRTTLVPAIPSPRVATADIPTSVSPITADESLTAYRSATRTDVDQTTLMSGSSGIRQTAKMHRLRTEETDIVERATAALRAIEVVVDIAPPDIQDLPTERLPVTLVPAVASATAAPRPPSRRAPHRWPAVCAAWALAVIVIVGLFAATGTLTRHTQPRSFVPSAARVAGNGAIVPLSGPWDSSAGAVNYLGVGGGAGPGVQAPGTAGIPVKPATPAPRVAPTAAPTTAPAPAPSGISPAPLSPWPPTNAFMAVPGRPGYAVAEPNPDNYWWAFGQCTWWAQHERSDENLTHMGNAQYWAAGAAARGYRTGGVPVAGATAVFQPGVQGAGGAGHVAHVLAVYPDGWFLVSEMNFFWNGGGWARVDYRYAHAGDGVSFIY